MKAKAIIFDFNGVLFWDSHLHENAWAQYSKKIRGTALSSEEMVHHVHGRTNKDILEYLLGNAPTAEDLKTHTEGKESIYRQLCLAKPEEFRLAPGAVELLDYLKAKNISRTIATSSEIGNLTFFWENLGLENWFNKDTVAYDDGHMAGKPAPDIYLRAVKNMQLPASHCLVVEDSVSGIASAHNAGISEIVAIGSAGTHPTLAQTPGVTIVISDFFELLELLRTGRAGSL